MQQTALTSDIQRALQHAVGEANSAFAHTNDEQAKKKKKTKRARADDGTHEGPELEQTRKERQKKQKRQHDGHDATDGGLSVRLSQVAEQDTTTVEQPAKKRSKNNGKQPIVQQPEVLDFNAHAQNLYQQIDPQLMSQSAQGSQASTAAFLSAIVAAASATSESQLHTHPHPLPHEQVPYHDHHLPPGVPAPHPQQFLEYSPLNFSYPGEYTPGHPPAAYANPMDIPLPDIMMGSNEDILRAFQDMDVSKITSALKTLGDAAAAANVTLTDLSPFMPPPAPPHTQLQPSTSVGQAPSSSDSILHHSANSTKIAEHKRTLDMTLPGPEQHANPEHARLLATKWMNAGKLAEMVRTQGLVYKKGKFSAIEEQQLKNAIEDYSRKQGLTEEQLNELIFLKTSKADETSFWSDITSAVPQRPIIAVYHHVRRGYHPLKQQGRWMPTEDDLLKQAVAELGQQWEKVSLRVGRMSSDCRDRYRNHIANRDKRLTGHWTKDEEIELTRIVTEMTIQQGRDADNDVFWGQVSERMGNRRGRQQCRIKWTDSLSKTVKNEGQKPRWGQQDAYILVHKVDSLNVRDDTEIDWKTLSDPHWNLWSAHSLQRRWLTMKRSIKGYEEMTHQEIMDILRVKKADFPAPSSSGTRKRKVTSAAAIMDSDNAVPDGESLGGHQPVRAGTSTGPGTFAQAEVENGVEDATGNGHSQDADGSTDSSE